MGNPIRVLHVDDDRELAELTATYLARENERLDVDIAGGAGEGLDRLAATDYDCVVSDYDMDGRNGVEFLTAVREDHPDVPFILFTGKGSEEVASEAISAGVTDYLQKETGTGQYTVLANRIENYVERSRAVSERERHLNAIETAQEGIAILDSDGRIRYANESCGELYGYDSAELVGEHWELLRPEWEVDHLRREAIPAAKSEGGWRGETTGLRADGTTFVEDHALAITADGGLICTVRDLSGRKEQARRFRAIFDNAYTFVGLLDPDGTVLEANRTALEFGGADREDVVGMPLWDAVWFREGHGPGEAAREGVETAQQGEFYRTRTQVSGVDRDAIIDFSIRPVTDDDDEVVLLVAEGRDVTEREERIRWIETLIDNLPGIVYRCENAPDWPMVDFRGEIESLTGYAPSAFDDRTDLYGSEVIHPDDRERVWETTQERIEAGESFELSYRIRTKGGETKHVWERGQPVDVPGENGEFAEGVITDVTERERLLRKLREERQFVPQALDALQDVFYAVGVDGRFRRWNNRLEEVSGYDASEIEEMEVPDFFPPEEHERVAKAIVEVLESGSATVEADLKTRDGSRVPYEFAGVRLTNPEAEMDEIVGIGRSIADRDGGGGKG